MRPALVLLVVLAIATTACGPGAGKQGMDRVSENPLAPTITTPSGHCRRLTTAYYTTIAEDPAYDRYPTSCQVVRSVPAVNCSVYRSNGTLDYVTEDVYASIADLIDEVRVIPPIQRRVRRVTSLPDANGLLVPGAVTSYVYDAQRRLIREERSDNVLEYLQHDAVGRPLRYRVAGQPGDYELSYDDAARTTFGRYDSHRWTIFFDEDGNVIHRTEANEGRAPFLTWDTHITATEQVCP